MPPKKRMVLSQTGAMDSDGDGFEDAVDIDVDGDNVLDYLPSGVQNDQDIERQDYINIRENMNGVSVWGLDLGLPASAEQTWLELEEQRIEQQQELAALKSRTDQVEASIREAREQRVALDAEFRGRLLTKLAETERRIDQLQQERVKASQRRDLKRMTAPVGGVVQQLAVHTIGGVVTPAQELMKIVPESESLEVEAWVLNKDIGFVQEGQAAEVKIETFPFTRYGTIDAEMLDVSNDAITDEHKGLVYAARVLMKDSVIRVGEKLVNLTPGMAVTVEVKTGKRRLIEFILSPLLRYKSESLGER